MRSNGGRRPHRSRDIAAVLSALAVLAFGAPQAEAEHRSYELVSPTDKNGGQIERDVIGHSATIGVSPDGERVAYGARAHFGELDGASLIQQYVSVRDEDSWTTYSATPPPGPTTTPISSGVPFLSEDLAAAVVTSRHPLTPQAELLAGEYGLYLRTTLVSPPQYTLLSVPAAPLAPVQPSPAAFDFVGASASLDRVVFQSRRQLLPSGPPDDRFGLYEWRGGEVSNVGVVPGGLPPTANVYGGARDPFTSFFYPGQNVISAEGRRIYFTVDGAADADGLYMREDSTQTLVVSASEREGDDPTAPTNSPEFLAATGDGAVAFFASPHKLTDNATAAGDGARDLYRWNRAAPPGQRLTDLTTADPGGGGVLGLAAATDDGARLYFVATGDLAAGAVAGEPNLYLWQQGDGVSHVATLNDADQAVWSFDRTGDRLYRDARIDSGGRYLLFASRAQLTGYDTNGHKQLYLFDAEANELTCVSCSPRSEASEADAHLLALSMAPPSLPAGAPLTLPRNLVVDDGGVRVFFETVEPLVARDSNGRLDVYEWTPGDGPQLVSSGEGGSHSRFVGASEDGSSVFFVTREQLLPSDRDDLGDVYVARTGDVFPLPEVPPSCVGDECQPPPTEPPATEEPGSSDHVGPGNPVIDDQRCRQLANRADQLSRRARARMSAARRLERKAKRLARRASRSARKAARARRQAAQARREAQRSQQRATTLRGRAAECRMG